MGVDHRTLLDRVKRLEFKLKEYEMAFLLFIVFGFILWGITSFGIERLDSKIPLLSIIKSGIFWLIITPLWIVYALIALGGLVNSTDIIQENFSDTKTVYFIYCSDFKHNNFSCPDDENIFTKKVDFKVSFDKQFVVEDFYTANRYNKCSVFDANNWKCEEEGKTYNVQDGNYSEYDENKRYPTLDKDEKPSVLPLFTSTNKSEYLVRELINFFKLF